MTSRILIGLAGCVVANIGFLAISFGFGYYYVIDNILSLAGQLMLQLLLAIIIARRCSRGFKHPTLLAIFLVVLTVMLRIQFLNLGWSEPYCFLHGASFHLPPETVLNNIRNQVLAIQTLPPTEADMAGLDKIAIPVLNSSLNGNGRYKVYSGLHERGGVVDYQVFWLTNRPTGVLFTTGKFDPKKTSGYYIEVYPNIFFTKNDTGDACLHLYAMLYSKHLTKGNFWWIVCLSE